MVQAVIDRFEENKAVLLVGEAEQKVVFPRECLPENLQEGDYLRLDISYDAAATEAARQEAQELLAELDKKNDGLQK